MNKRAAMTEAKTLTTARKRVMPSFLCNSGMVVVEQQKHVDKLNTWSVHNETSTNIQNPQICDSKEAGGPNLLLKGRGSAKSHMTQIQEVTRGSWR